MLQMRDVSMTYGDVVALDGLDLAVPKGCFYGLLGPNGAGKSTAIHCLAGLRSPVRGQIHVADIDVSEDPEAARRHIGLVPQGLALYPELSVLDNLRTFAGLYGMSKSQAKLRIDWALELAQLGDKRSRRVQQLSGGMARRLNLACGLLHDPELIVCDEPTAGVDPQSRNHIFEILRSLHAEGRTLVYTTHYMEEVEALCQRVGIMDRGRLLAEDELSKLLTATDASSFTVQLTEGAPADRLREALAAADIETDTVIATQRSLEDVFLDLTGRRLRDGEGEPS